jgi:hypothetical protein
METTDETTEVQPLPAGDIASLFAMMAKATDDLNAALLAQSGSAATDVLVALAERLALVRPFDPEAPEGAALHAVVTAVIAQHFQLQAGALRDAIDPPASPA